MDKIYTDVHVFVKVLQPFLPSHPTIGVSHKIHILGTPCRFQNNFNFVADELGNITSKFKIKSAKKTDIKAKNISSVSSLPYLTA